MWIAIIFLGVLVVVAGYSADSRLDKLKKTTDRHDAFWSGYFDDAQDTHGRLSDISDRLRALESKERPHTPKEDTLKALGGAVDKCYDSNGKLQRMCVSAPWLSEPIYSPMSLYYGYSTDSTAEIVAEEALKALVQKINKPTGKKK